MVDCHQPAVKLQKSRNEGKFTTLFFFYIKSMTNQCQMKETLEGRADGVGRGGGLMANHTKL